MEKVHRVRKVIQPNSGKAGFSVALYHCRWHSEKITGQMGIVCLLAFFALTRWVHGDLRIEVMKEGLTDLKVTQLQPPNIMAFIGSAALPDANGVDAELVMFTPLNGCAPLGASKYTTKDAQGAIKFTTVSGTSDNVIVIMARGGCPFNEKFANAGAIQNVVGVLIYNDPADSMPDQPIVLTNPGRDPPGYLISNSLGTELIKKIYKYRGGSGTADDSKLGDTVPSATILSATPYLSIRLTQDSVDSQNTVNKIYQYCLIGIIALLSMAFGISIILHMRNSAYMAQASSAPPDDHDRNNILPPIDVEFLQKLPLKTFRGRRSSKDQRNAKSSQGESPKEPDSTTGHMMRSASGILSPTAYEPGDSAAGISPIHSEKSHDATFFDMIEHNWPMNESCPICLDEFNQGEVLNELPCGHCYHIACIQPWLQYRSPYCPLCKLDVREEYHSNTKQAGDLESNNQASLDNRQLDQQNRLKRIWDKLVLKSHRSNADHLPPSQITSVAAAHQYQIEMPPRALITDTAAASGFQSVPLTEENL